MERTCQVQLLAEATGHTPRLIADDVAAQTGKTLGNSMAGWFQYQPLWQEISREQPDLFE